MIELVNVETPPRALRERRAVRAERPPMLTRPVLLLFVAAFGAMTSFYLLVSVVPLYAASVGIDQVGVGLTTGALMLGTVVAELFTPRLLTAVGARWSLAAALLLLGAPVLALAVPLTEVELLVACAVRGLGFGVMVVVAGAMVATLVPAERRGEGLGAYGIVAGVPGVLALPLGVWMVGHVGLTPVVVVGAVTALAGLAVVWRLPAGDATELAEAETGVVSGLRMPALLRPAVAFGATAMAAGVVVTFLPLVLAQGGGSGAGAGAGSLGALALLAQAAAATLARWWAGRLGDRHGPARLLVPCVVVAAVGVLTVAVIGGPAGVLVGMVLFGAGFGAAQNASMAAMLDRVNRSGYGMVSAVWNLAYDSGLGLGAVGFGVVVSLVGPAPAMAVTAGVVLVALVPALLRGRRDDGRRSRAA